MSVATNSAGFGPRRQAFWRRLRRPGRRRRDLALTFLSLLVNSVWAALLVLTMRAPAHMRQYISGAILSIALIWTVVIAYVVLTPPTYTSHWSFILPSSSSSVSLQLESIGHAQTVASSPFGSTSLSPKVIYKEIIASERVRLAAAEALGLTLRELGQPSIKLIDETALLLLEMKGRTPEDSQRKAGALIDAFNRQIDELRRDEIRRRAAVVQESLKTYQLNLQAARERILDQQRKTGVLSINQFNDAATSLELMRRKLAEVRAEISRLSTEQQQMTTNLGLDNESAALLLRLAGDPAFYKLATDFADANAMFQTDSIRMGPQNPVLALSRNKAEAAFRQLRAVTRAVAGNQPMHLDRLLLLLNGTNRAELLKSLVANNAQIAGKQEELKTLEQEYSKLEGDVTRMSTDAARLEDLKKDHLVAEAVFTSALARLDTNKIDIYASYPMVQTLAAPDLPVSKSSPYVLIAAAAGVLGSLLATAGWGMAWLRHMFGHKLSKRR